jgi:hypothetical protein
MNNDFGTYEQAVALKELGFDEECFAFYNGKFLDSTDYNFDDGTSKDIGLCIKAPLKSQVFRWFREKYADVLVKDYGLIPHFTMISNMFLDSNKIWTYEEAENACINKLIEIAKQK